MSAEISTDKPFAIFRISAASGILTSCDCRDYSQNERNSAVRTFMIFRIPHFSIRIAADCVFC